jgi:hypothetical protein
MQRNSAVPPLIMPLCVECGPANANGGKIASEKKNCLFSERSFTAPALLNESSLVTTLLCVGGNTQHTSFQSQLTVNEEPSSNKVVDDVTFI